MFQLDSDIYTKNRAAGLAERLGNSSVQENDEKVKNAKIERASQLLQLVKGNPGAWSAARQQAISEGLGNEQTLPMDYPGDKWIGDTLTAFEPHKSGAGGGSTIAAAQQIMSENPGMSFTDAYSISKSGLGQGIGADANGVRPMQGAPDAKKQMSFSSKLGSQNAIIDTAAEVERQRKIGEGAITPKDQQAKGQKQMSSVVSDLNSYYDQLDQAGGAVNTDKSAASNVSAYMANTAGGQLVGKMAGTPTQSIRNKISMARPALINAIRQSTGMSAKAMDSNVELQFYLQQATDPKLDLSANKAALTRINEMYGKGGVQSDSPNLNSIIPQDNQPKQAPDGNFYVPDPQRPGKYLQVVQ